MEQVEEGNEKEIKVDSTFQLSKQDRKLYTTGLSRRKVVIKQGYRNNSLLLFLLRY